MDSNLIYINLDGFGRYYFDEINDKEKDIPNIMSLIKDGVFFENARTGIPSMTYPMQSAIVTGAYSSVTGNCYQYLDKDKNEIIQMKRYNKAQTIGELLRKENIPTVSIQQFTLEDRGCEYGNKEFLYIQPMGDYAVRFPILENLIRNQRIELQGQIFQYEKMPRAVFMYIDDLDTIGHNSKIFVAETEKERRKNVINRILQIDAELGKVITALKDKGLYDNTYILLTTDHGMISYSGFSMLSCLKDELHALGFGKVLCQSPGPLTDNSYDVVLTSHALQCQVYFKDDNIDLVPIKKHLMNLSYVDSVLTRDELKEHGVSELYADILVSPTGGNHFSTRMDECLPLYANHDSLHDNCQHIFATIKGKKIIPGLTYKPVVDIIDFIPTLCCALGLPELENSAGRVLSDIFNY